MAAVLRFIQKATDFVSGQLQAVVVFLMMILILVDVVSRYILNDPLSIAEEYGGYLLVTVTCIGLAYTWQQRSHVRVEFLINSLPVKLRRLLRLFSLLLALIFTGAMVYGAYELVQFSFMFGTRSGSWLRTPVAWPQVTIIIGAGLIFLQIFVDLMLMIKRFGVAEEEGE
jgi:TRAP-type C4-dicarboxylate transport system permease small subunit